MDDIIEKIRNMKLTKKDEVIAEYISDHLATIGMQTSLTLAEEIGVSDTSIIRFTRKLGFKSYADFRSEMNSRMAEQYEQNYQENLMTGEKFSRTKERLKHDSLIADVSSYVLDNLEKSLSHLNENLVDQVTEILLKSNRKYIVGFRGSASCASYMSSRMVLLLPQVTLVSHADSAAIEQLADIGSDDCILIYSLPRYSKIHGTLMQIAKKRGAKIILVTDRQTSSLAAKADVVLVAKVEGMGFVNSYIAPMCISEIILLSVSSRCGDAGVDRVRYLDDLMEQENLY